MTEEQDEDVIKIKMSNGVQKVPGTVDPFYKKISEYPEVEKLMQNVKGDAGSKAIEDYSESVLYGGLDVAEPLYNPGNLAKLYDTNPFHASAVDAKNDSVVGLGYSFEYNSKTLKRLEKVEKSNNGEEKKRKLELALDDARDTLQEIIDGMNRQDEFEEILFKVYHDRLTMGNAYIEIGRTVEGKIGYIGHVSPVNVRVRKRRDGFIQMSNGRVVFFRNFGDTKTVDPTGSTKRPNELIHIKRYHPLDAYYGAPEIVAALDAVAGLHYAEQFNIDYFENKAVPRYIIKVRGFKLSAADQEELVNFFETSVKGQSHRSILLPMPQGEKDIDFEPIEAGKQEGHFGEYIKQTIQFILSRHRVPQARIGLSSAATSQAESRESEKTFKETVCQPEQRLLEKKINKVLKEVTDLFVFKLKEYSLSDEDTQSQIDERRLRMGVDTPDEIRLRDGKGPRPDGKGNEALDMRVLAELTGQQNAISQRKAEQKAQSYQTRTRDQNRNANNPDKNPNNRDGRRAAGEGKHPNKKLFDFEYPEFLGEGEYHNDNDSC